MLRGLSSLAPVLVQAQFVGSLRVTPVTHKVTKQILLTDHLTFRLIVLVGRTKLFLRITNIL